MNEQTRKAIVERLMSRPVTGRPTCMLGYLDMPGVPQGWVMYGLDTTNGLVRAWLVRDTNPFYLEGRIPPGLPETDTDDSVVGLSQDGSIDSAIARATLKALAAPAS